MASLVVPLDEDEACPVCQNTRYLNPSMKMLFSPCYHRMCDSCVHRLFSSGAAPCPICKTLLRKSQFALQTFEDLFVEKEIRLRRHVAKYMSKTEEDFPTLLAYNDYLELVEDYVFQLLNDQNIQQVYAELEQFRLENKQSVEKAIRKRLLEEKEWQENLVEDSRRKAKWEESERQETRAVALQEAKEKESLITELMNSDQPASLLLAKKQQALAEQQRLRPSSSVVTNTRPVREKRHMDRSDDMIPMNDSRLQRVNHEEYMKDCFSWHIAFPPLPISPKDPRLAGWVETPEVMAGGARSHFYQLRAVQALYIHM